MTIAESTPVGYNYSTSSWLAASRGASVTGYVATFGSWTAPRAPWLKAIADRLKDLFLLDTGWDGGVAPPIEPRLIELTWRVAQQVAEYLPTVQPPQVVPTVNGGISLEWTRDESELSIELGDRARLYYDIPSHRQTWEGEFTDSPVNPGELLLANFA